MKEKDLGTGEMVLWLRMCNASVCGRCKQNLLSFSDQVSSKNNLYKTKTKQLSGSNLGEAHISPGPALLEIKLCTPCCVLFSKVVLC